MSRISIIRKGNMQATLNEAETLRTEVAKLTRERDSWQEQALTAQRRSTELEKQLVAAREAGRGS